VLAVLFGIFLGVVGETMQPAHASLWLRSHTTFKGKQVG
jgi:hypothetical protein